MDRPAAHPAAEAGAADTPTADDLPIEPGSEGGGEPAAEDAAQAGPPPIDPQVAWYQGRIASLQRDIDARDEKLREYIAAYKKAVAEMDAARERLERDKEKVIDRDRMDLVAQLLDVLDNFDRSIHGVKLGGDVDSLRQGLGMVRGQLAQVLTGFGVERIDAVGGAFDAARHEAAGMVPAQAHQRDQEVVFEERAGYLYKGKLLRPSRVIIASRPD